MNELYVEMGFRNLEQKFNIHFNNKDILVEAFLHSSFKRNQYGSYERLEFLGDSVLQIVISDYLFNIKPAMPEGDMTRFRASIVSENALAYIVKKIGLVDYLMLGKSIVNEGGEFSNSYIADIFESFVAAIYIDQGFDYAKKFIYDYLISNVDEIKGKDFSNDFKTKLQELLQVNGPINLVYDTISSKNGFDSKLLFDDVLIGQGSGRNKKVAEQQAAKDALNKMVDNESSR